jgi:hypothetical protein
MGELIELKKVKEEHTRKKILIDQEEFEARIKRILESIDRINALLGGTK